MSKLKNTQSEYKTLFCLFAIVFVWGTSMNINNVLTKIMQEFPTISQTNIRLLSTLPSILSTVISLLVGGVIGKKIGYKTTVFLGILFYTIAETGPAFLGHNFTVLMLLRVLSGIGQGLIVCVTGYVMLMSTDATKARNVALVTIVNNLAGILFGLLAGYLGEISWPMAFLPSILGIIPIALALPWMKEPVLTESAPTAAEAMDPRENVIDRLSSRTFLYIGLVFVFSIVGMSWMTGMSELLREKGISSASLVSLVLVGCRLGAAIGGALFAKLSAKGSKTVMFVMTIMGALSCALVVYASNIALMLFAGVLSGTSYFLGVVMCNTYAGMSNKRSKVTLATTLTAAGLAVATFVSSYYIAICGNVLGNHAPTFTSATFLVSAGIMIAMLIISRFVDFGPREA